jgi:hypothetical protein
LDQLAERLFEAEEPARLGAEQGAKPATAAHGKSPLVKTDVLASVSEEGIEYPLGLVLQGVIAGVGGRQPRPPVYGEGWGQTEFLVFCGTRSRRPE